jgi:hypothetical protein
MADLYTQKVTAWIDEKIKATPESRQTIEVLKNNLDFSRMEETPRVKGKVLVIPIKDEYKKAQKLQPDIIPNLLVSISDNGEIRTANVVLYMPNKGQTITELPKKTFYNICNTAHDVVDGTFKFCGLSGKRQYQLQYDSGYLKAISQVQNGKDQTSNAAGGNRVKSNYVYECSDVYLVTSYYVNDVLVSQTREFLYRQGNCGSPGTFEVPQPDPGAGGNEPPEELIFAKSVRKTWWVNSVSDTGAIYKTNTFTTYDDYFIIGIGAGPLTMNHVEVGTIVLEVNAFDVVAQDLRSATTTCIVSVYFPFAPNSDPISGAKTWYVSELLH